MIRVVVSGAAGRMGALCCDALERAPDLELCGRLVRGDDPAAVLDGSSPDVLLDFTLADASPALVAAAVERGIAPVIGTSGWPAAAVTALGAACAARDLGALLVPNFSVGAVLQMRFAAQAARWLACTGISETHHTGKRDAPSGTARATAEAIAKAGGPVPEITSARRDGLVAEQVVGFEAEGERLELLHHVGDRRAYLPGVLLAVRGVRDLDGLSVGLDVLLG